MSDLDVLGDVDLGPDIRGTDDDAPSWTDNDGEPNAPGIDGVDPLF